MADEKKTEENYMQLQLLQQQIQQLTEYLEKLQDQQKELHNSIEALEGLQKTEVDTEILAPVANGIFVRAELKNNQKLTVNVGAGITAEKNLSEILTLLEEQKEKIAENISEAEAVLQQLHEHGRRMFQESSEAAG